MYGNTTKKDDADLIKLMEQFQLFNSDDIDLNYQVNNKSLSSGQMQKVAFIRSLLADVEILLLDESTSNLDYDSKILFNNELKNSSLTIINSTHNISESFYDFHLHIDVKDETRSIRNI